MGYEKNQDRDIESNGEEEVDENLESNQYIILFITFSYRDSLTQFDSQIHKIVDEEPFSKKE